MSRLIDADKLLEELRECHPLSLSHGILSDIEMILNCIKCPPYAVKCKGRESEMKESMCYLCKRDWLDSEVDK